MAPSSVLNVQITANNHVLLWTFTGSADVSGCTGANLQAAGDDGDYHEPLAVLASTSNTLTCQYEDFFDPGNGAWAVQALPTGIVLNGSTFAIPEGGFF